MELRAVSDLTPAERTALFNRDDGLDDVEDPVLEIVERVREEGDVAIREFSREFDDVEVGNLDVTDEAERAYSRLDGELRDHIERAATNIESFHKEQLPKNWQEEFDGRELGRRFRPLERVGAYVPGGTAAYPTSALMTLIPASVAGVEHVSVTTPPAKDLDDATLAAIHVAGADAVYQIGGAQAIAALAYGTETVNHVQKVVGPGNRFVTAAKAVVRGECEIDFLAGPSEILVLADSGADPALVAADLIAQAEHDSQASVVAITDDDSTARAIIQEVEDQATIRERADVVQAALANDTSGVFVARSMSEAVLFASEYAPEHLSIQAANDESLLERISVAGSVFLGPYSAVAAGDYATGPNHVLPTGGHARTQGGLSVDHFVVSQTVQRLDREALADIADTITALAETEGLEAHAESIRRRFADE